MYKIITTNRFEKDVALCKKRGYNISLLRKAISILEQEGKLPAKYKPHKLTGNYKEHWECHLQPDWLLIWKQNDKELILLFTNTGTHSDLF
ncbi:MAG TPA: type II toxin-antitoxin system YafQ family toxin [Paludibacteraceae bacterium]|nr:type II toxin-antitoxin system YafQ family toxin [Paludibacteraceae bacterium]HOS37463.1 type II toxin-antitoxin system YafQ family toxin [Paludibacteraceae bacterium]HPK20331.1 type II toxin-antitoxin system YafQ family toxin [Paludibacteraceae bacterium]